MNVNNCPFCLPEIENATFAKSENFRAVYNLAPVFPGHVLVMPKKHIKSFIEIGEDLLTEMVVFSQKVVKTLKISFNCEAFDWTIQDGKHAGQSVEHMHLHIIPRYENDLPDPGDWYPILQQKQIEIIDSFSRPKLQKDDLKTIVKKLREDYKF